MTHTAVLSNEAAEALVWDRNGTYVDGTYGRGGHAGAILARLGEEGRLIAIDRDLAAVMDARERFAGEQRITVIHGAFGELDKHVESAGAGELSGVLIDLGVSSPQLEEARRGFSFDRDGPLDMRMDQESGFTAAHWIAMVGERELAWVLRTYGEERFARQIARAIARAREQVPIETTRQLAEIIERAVPRIERQRHPATRSFQAIRILINDELGELENCLGQALRLLRQGGRLVVISFHSLEDRIVKRFMRTEQRGDPFPSRLPVRDSELRRTLRIMGKPRRPTSEEVVHNRRARSAVMRVAEKVG